MKKVLFSLITVMLVLTSCGADPVKFNDSIVDEQTAMTSLMEEYGSKLGQAIAGGSLDDAKVLGDSLTAKLDKSIEVVKGLDTPSNGEKLKEAAVAYFESIKKFAAIGGEVPALGGEEPSQESVAAMTAFVQEMNTMSNELVEKDNAFLAAQKEFAAANKMELR